MCGGGVEYVSVGVKGTYSWKKVKRPKLSCLLGIISCEVAQDPTDDWLASVASLVLGFFLLTSSSSFIVMLVVSLAITLLHVTPQYVNQSYDMPGIKSSAYRSCCHENSDTTTSVPFGVPCI